MAARVWRAAAMTVVAVAGAWAGDPSLPAPDADPRPVRIGARFPAGSLTRMLLLPAAPAGARVELTPGAGPGPSQRAARHAARHPGALTVNGAIARVAVPVPDQLELYWSGRDRQGTAWWPTGPGAAAQAAGMAALLDAAWQSDAPDALSTLAARLPDGAWIELHFQDPRVGLRLAGGPQGPARVHELLRTVLGRWRDLTPVGGLVGPAWRSSGPLGRGWLWAGLAMGLASGAEAERDLAWLSGRMARVGQGP